MAGGPAHQPGPPVWRLHYWKPVGTDSSSLFLWVSIIAVLPGSPSSGIGEIRDYHHSKRTLQKCKRSCFPTLIPPCGQRWCPRDAHWNDPSSSGWSRTGAGAELIAHFLPFHSNANYFQQLFAGSRRRHTCQTEAHSFQLCESGSPSSLFLSLRMHRVQHTPSNRMSTLPLLFHYRSNVSNLAGEVCISRKFGWVRLFCATFSVSVASRHTFTC